MQKRWLVTECAKEAQHLINKSLSLSELIVISIQARSVHLPIACRAIPGAPICWLSASPTLAPETWESLMRGFPFPKGMREEVVWGEERYVLSTAPGKPSPCPLRAIAHPQTPQMSPPVPHTHPSACSPLPAAEVDLPAQL